MAIRTQLHADLLDGFQTVTDKRRADNEHASDALLGQARQFKVSVGSVSYTHLTLPTILLV